MQKHPTIIEVRMVGDGKLATFTDAAALMEQHGTDPAMWCVAIATIIESVSQAHASALVDPATGKNPAPAEVRQRILEELPQCLADYRDREPLGTWSMAEFNETKESDA